jgi:hypothetical protein
MRNLKKALALAVVFTMMLTLFAGITTASAAEDYSASVQRLVGLGLLKGYDNGDLGENDPITRAQFAAVVVRALGLETAASAAKYDTPFSDIPGTHWAAGYVNVASQMGIVNGVGDGRFDGDAQVSFKDAVTMVVRALGYEPAAKAKGGYPVGYLVVASEKEITKDISVDVNRVAARGLVAKVVDNALNKPFMVQKGYTSTGTINYEEDSSVTIMNKLGYLKAEEIVVTKTPLVGADADKFVAGGVEYKNVSKADLDSFLGLKVNVWYKDNTDKETALIEKVTADEDILAVKEMSKDGSKLKIKDSTGTEKSYELASTVNYAKNFDIGTAADADAVMTAFGTDNGLRDIKVVLDDDGKVAFVNGYVYRAAQKVDSVTINKVSNIKRITFKNSAPAYYLQNDEEAATYTIIKDGEEIELADIQEDDLVYAAAKTDITVNDDTVKDNKVRLLVVNNVVEGKLQAVAPNTTSATKVKIDGTYYDLLTVGAVSIALDSNVKARLDKDGKVFELEGVDAEKNYAVILNIGKSTNGYGVTTYNVKLMKADGTTVEYATADDAKTAIKTTLDAIANNSYDKDTMITKGILVEYTLNSDGNVDTLTKKTDGNATNVVIKKDRKTINGIIAENVPMLNVVAANNTASGGAFDTTDDADVDVVTWANITKDYGIGDGINLIANIEDDIVVFAGATFTTDTNYALVAGKEKVKDGYSLTLYTNGEEKVYVTTSDSVYKDPGDVVTFTLDNDGKVNAISPASNANNITTPSDVEAVYSNRIKVGGVTYFFADDVAVYYDKDNAHATDDFAIMSKAELYKDMKVKLYFNSDNDVIVIVVTAK